MPDHSRAVRPIEDDARGRRAMGTSIAGYRLFAPRALLVPAKPWLRIKAPWATGAAGVTGKPADGSYAVAAKRLRAFSKALRHPRSASKEGIGAAHDHMEFCRPVFYTTRPGLAAAAFRGSSQETQSGREMPSIE
jgi:hypothetical protein